MQLFLNLALITSMFTFNLMQLIEAALYKDDPCFTKSEVGLCKPWAECPTIRNLLESGAYKLKEVEHCGYEVKEEIICCPKLKTDVKISDTTDRTGVTNTDSQDLSAGPVNIFKKSDNCGQKYIANNNRLQKRWTEDIISINQLERSRQSEMPPIETGKRNVESSNESRNNETSEVGIDFAQQPTQSNGRLFNSALEKPIISEREFLKIFRYGQTKTTNTTKRATKKCPKQQFFCKYPECSCRTARSTTTTASTKAPNKSATAHHSAQFQHINANSSEIRAYPPQRTIPLWLEDNKVKFNSNSSSNLLICSNHPQREHYHIACMLKQKVEFKNSTQIPQFIRQMLGNNLEKELSATGVITPNNQSLVDNFENNITANGVYVSKQCGSIRRTNISESGNSERAAVRACKKLETREQPAHLTPHILEGVPAALGEFPHMAGIGYSRSIGDDSPPYIVRCGGALISARFVLTAAHCVASRDNVPKAVVLGVVNFNDPEEMSAALQIKIKETHIHDNYTSSTTYNDIALLELEQDAEYSAFVYPSCLHIDENDPSESETLLVTGWGTVNTATRASSDILLKVSLDIKPLASCNEIFAKYGSDRRLTQGVVKTLLCAGDKEAKKDACSGDSGGPLNLVIDESYRQYRIVGIVSSGFGCGTSIPGLYTRVALFLDYIEKIVWPDGVV
uniref:Peptidase S1 domain-containing protein n=1 Tax=Glossina palpalis gambiensis TaxID=67801 RepID=A0A1B0BYS1_9MUSC